MCLALALVPSIDGVHVTSVIIPRHCATDNTTTAWTAKSNGILAILPQGMKTHPVPSQPSYTQAKSHFKMDSWYREGTVLAEREERKVLQVELDGVEETDKNKVEGVEFSLEEMLKDEEMGGSRCNGEVQGQATGERGLPGETGVSGGTEWLGSIHSFELRQDTLSLSSHSQGYMHVDKLSPFIPVHPGHSNVLRNAPTVTAYHLCYDW
ncbi:hypothetical protein BKA83DRAFT_4122804 [Pisolithus microcarpus]|nr:hypothetical protein BKA83DRAFT_4122804 [Pisolithus microcarpus]